MDMSLKTKCVLIWLNVVFGTPSGPLKQMTMALSWQCLYIVVLLIRQTDYPTGIRQPASDKSTSRALVDANTNIYVNLI